MNKLFQHTRLLILILAITLLQNNIFSKPNGLSLIAHLDKRHGTGSGLSYNGCWGWTHPNGREYAIVGTYTGTAFIDITDSAKEVAFLTGPTSEWREMRTYKNYAYIVSEGGGGTQIVDLSNLPNSISLRRSFTYTSAGKNTAASHTVEIFDGYLYLNGCANWNPGGVLIFNLAVPDSPKYVGQYQQQYAHDCYVRNDTLYAAAVYNGGGINIANIANKANPTHITKISYTGSGTHNLWTTRDGHYLMTTDEIGNTAKTLKFWDISGLPIAPTSTAATYTISPGDIVHNVTMRGNYAYVAWYTAGSVVVDITNPLVPVTAGSYDSYPGSSGSYDGVWAIYPYFPSGKIVSSDIETGCYVFTYENLHPRTPVHLMMPAENDTLSVDSSIAFQWNETASQIEDPHYFMLEIRGDGVNISQRVTDTSFTLSNVSGFISGKSYSWKVYTMDEVNEIQSVDTFTFNYGAPIPFSVMTVSSDSLGFGKVRVDTSKFLPVTIGNAGTGSLVIDSIRFSHPAFSTTIGDNQTITPTNSLGIEIKFSPLDTSFHTNIMTLYTNDIERPAYQIKLTGKGYIPAPAISVTRDSLLFGNVFINNAKTLPITIRNTGTAPLIIDSIHCSLPLFVSVMQDSGSIAPSDTVRMLVTFTPVDSSVYNAELMLYTNIFNTPVYTIHLKGRGVLPNSVREGELIPAEYSLLQNFPNPFNPVTSISFSIPEENFVSLKVFTLLGQDVLTLVDGVKPAGVYSVTFDASNLNSGMYLYRFTAGKYSTTKKMVLMK